MTENSEIFKEDMEWICKADLPWEKLRNSTILVTGGTGLIGMTMISALIHAGRERGLGLSICAIVRDTAKAGRVLGSLVSAPELTLLTGTMEKLPSLPEKIDYWIHGACPTASAFMNEHPVESSAPQWRERPAFWRRQKSETRRDSYFFPAWKLSEK